MLIDVVKVTKDFGFGEVLASISFSVNSGDRIALVGKNGCGKSTMLKIISGKEDCSGQVIVGKNVRIGFLDQTAPDQKDSRTVEEILQEPFVDVFKKLKTMQAMEEKMMTLDGYELEKLVEKYSDFQEKFIADGGYEVETAINYVVNGLKIDQSLRSHNYDTLSGGEKTLVHFARILLENPEILLLDEPTNHLDIERIEWLESYIQRFKGAVIVVSHDRYFLDKVAKRVIDLENGGEKYEGNYSYFVKEKENKELREFEQYKNEQKKIEELKKAVKRLYEWGMKADNPSMFRRAKAIQKRIDEMEENAISKPGVRKDISIKFQKTDRSGDIVFDIKDISLIMGDKILLEDSNAQIRVFDKVALVGKNGTGKSSLIKCIVGENVDYIGDIKIGGSVSIGYLPQLLVFENEKETILEYITSHTELDSQHARSLLARFDFYTEDIEKPIGTLSGGEKIRIKIACLLQNKVNTLIFDEPTNHIDIFTREILEDALKEFKGTILFVSHDRYFINNVANKILEITDTKLNLFDGNYDAYKNKDKVEVVKEEEVKIKIKPPKIRKGGKW